MLVVYLPLQSKKKKKSQTDNLTAFELLAVMLKMIIFVPQPNKKCINLLVTCDEGVTSKHCSALKNKSS